jgi:tetraacyldisaccharide 4'-kinase
MISRKQTFKRALLWLPAKLYAIVVRLRLLAYNRGYRKSGRLDAVVISVGNITVGGTGKTPMVAAIGQYLLRQGYRLAVLTRGYKRQSAGRRILNHPQQPQTTNASYLEFGDEPLLLARLLPQAPIVIHKNRYDSGKWAIEECGAEVLLLDDGYQHLLVHRDLNLLLLDATNPFGGGEVMPLGRLREPLEELKRADAVLITRANQSFDKDSVLQISQSYCQANTPVFLFSSAIIQFRNLVTGETIDSSTFAGKKAAIMCGIGNPRAFAEDLRQLGLLITSEKFFTDHHAYTQNDIDGVIEAAQKSGAEMIITTEKDAVRLENVQITGMAIYAAVLEMQSEQEAEFQQLLLQVVSRKKAIRFASKPNG